MLMMIEMDTKEKERKRELGRMSEQRKEELSFLP